MEGTRLRGAGRLRAVMPLTEECNNLHAISRPPTYMAEGPTSDGESLPPFLKGGREGAW